MNSRGRLRDMYPVRASSGRAGGRVWSVKTRRHLVILSMISIVIFIILADRHVRLAVSDDIKVTPDDVKAFIDNDNFISDGNNDNVITEGDIKAILKDDMKLNNSSIYHAHQQSHDEEADEIDIKLRNFLRENSLGDVIVVSSVGYGYIGLAINLYVTSYRKFGITNHVFVASDKESCGVLRKLGANCVEYILEKSSKDASLFYSFQFKRKAFIKTKIVIESLKAGLDTLLVDLDIVFFKNPLPLVRHACDTCDIIIQPDGEENNLNVGFYYARPTQATLQLLETSYNHMNMTRPQNTSQNIINQVLTEMRRADAIQQHTLDARKYPNGMNFFSDGKRMFKGTNPCSECVMVHNNYIMSMEGKQYRFKEYGLWQADEGGYYSDTKRKYLLFDNPWDFGEKDTMMHEFQSLKTAFTIGHLLNRTVILPRFHCYQCKHYEAAKGEMCHFGTFYHMGIFDGSFKNMYRESVFLENDLVPDSVKQSMSPVYLMDSSESQRHENIPKIAVTLEVADAKSGVKMYELRQWFMGEASSYSVLRFHSLYIDLFKSKEVLEFQDKLLDALVLSDFKQIRRKIVII